MLKNKRFNWIFASLVTAAFFFASSFTGSSESGGGTADCYTAMPLDCPKVLGGQWISCQFNGVYGGKIACQEIACVTGRTLKKCQCSKSGSTVSSSCIDQ